MTSTSPCRWRSGRASPEEWKAQLTPEQFQVARQGGTERAFTGAYWNHKEDGMYHCVCCDAPLFSSRTKFESGTGWPSFWDGVVSSGAIRTKEDRTHGMVRTEILCARCDGHLGHVQGQSHPHRSALLREQRFPAVQRYRSCLKSCWLIRSEWAW